MMLARSADRAPWNGAFSEATTNSSSTMPHSGMPGAAIAATSSIRATSAVIMTVRRGNRSARSDRNRPPTSHGR